MIYKKRSFAVQFGEASFLMVGRKFYEQWPQQRNTNKIGGCLCETSNGLTFGRLLNTILQAIEQKRDSKFRE